MIKDRGGAGLTSPNSPTNTTNPSGGDVAEGVSFDGSTDWLSKNGLTGSANSKTFTMSFFVYYDGSATTHIYSQAPLADSATNIVYLYTDGRLRIQSFNSSNVEILDVTVSLNAVVNKIKNTWISVIASMDMSNTANRYISVNDRIQSPAWDTYINEAIVFTEDANTKVCASISGSSVLKGRLSNFFLDYTYRDLSIEANRRLFIDADGKPVDASGLNPILYLPMTDASTAHINSGTGGDFVQNGTLATADRGANQDNCVMTSVGDVNEYLYKSALHGANVKQFTMSFTVKPIKSQTNTIMWGTGATLEAGISSNGDTHIYMKPALSIAGFKTSVLGQSSSVTVSLDTTIPEAKLMVNGTEITITQPTLDNTVNLSAMTELWLIGTHTVGVPFEGDFGEFWISTDYYDLATNNPFWDADNNRHKPVRQVLRETGANPLVAMPISADYPELNLGSAGNFTKNGTGYTGARGMSEYISRSVKPTSATTYLDRTSSIVTSSTTDLTMMLCFDKANIVSRGDILWDSHVTGISINYQLPSQGLTLALYPGGSNGYYIVISNTYFNATDNILLLSIDTSTNTVRLFINGIDRSGVASIASYGTRAIDFNQASTWIQLLKQESNYPWTDNFYEFYMADTYVDFSQESNRNLFVNQLGYPRDLQPLIDDATIATPFLHMKFDDPSNLGSNSGSGTDWTTQGALTNGADFNL